jgi:hypothetical protein
MKKIITGLTLAFAIALAGCASAQVATTASNGVMTTTTAPSGVAGLLAKDFAAAQADYIAAAAAQPAGSSLATQFTSNAQCMADAISKLQGAADTGSSQVSGIFSLGAKIDIQVLTAQNAVGTGPTAACKQLVGGLIMNLNQQILSGLPGLLIPKLF